MDWISKEVRLKSRLNYDLEIFALPKDHLVPRLRLEVDCSMVKNGGPWFIAGQLLAMEDWELDFNLGRRVIQKMVVWMRMPGLR